VNLLGHDVFISYSHVGAAAYADALSQQFRHRAWVPFLDREETAPSADQLERWLGKRLRRSKVLVLIVDHHALASWWVSWEVQTFVEGKPKAPVMAISLGDAITQHQLKGTAFEKLEGLSFLREDVSDVTEGRPSEATVRAINEALTFSRRGARLKQLLVMSSFIVLIVVVLAFLLGIFVGQRAH
jgi:hypothetical protein